jgi:hypothetical protein
MSEEVTLSLNFNIPDLLVDKIDISDPYQNYNTRGNPTSFGVDLDFDEMNLSKTLKSSEFYVLRGKIEDTLRNWENKYQRHLDKLHKENRAEHVDELNQEAKQAIETLNSILVHTLSIDDTVDWDAIKRKDAFRVKSSELFNDGKDPNFITFNSYGRPTGFEKIRGFFSKLFCFFVSPIFLLCPQNLPLWLCHGQSKIMPIGSYYSTNQFQPSIIERANLKKGNNEITKPLKI